MLATTDGLASDQPSRRVWWGGLLVVCILLLLPLAMVDVPPLLDYPNHLARLYVLAHPEDPVLSRFYAPHWTITPNLAIDLVVPPLLRLLPVHLVGRLVIGVTLLMPVIGCAAYHRSLFGQRSLWPLGAGLIACNGLLILGFLNFQISLGLAMLAAAGWHSWSHRPSVAAPVIGAGAAVVLFFAHIFGLAFFGVLVGAGELAVLRNVRRDGAALRSHFLRRGAMLAALFAPAGLLYYQAPLSEANGPVGWQPWHLKIQEIFGPFVHYRASVTMVTLFAVLGPTLVLIALRRLRPGAGTLIALATLTGLFLVMPASARGAALLDARLPIMIGFLLFAGFRPLVQAHPLRISMAAAMAAALVIRSVGTASVWTEQTADVAKLRAVIAPVAPGSLVLVAAASAPDGPEWWTKAPENRVLPGWHRLDAHLPALLLIEHQAFWPLLFTANDKQPVSVRPPYDRLIAEPGWLPGLDELSGQPGVLADKPAGYLANWRRDFDYLLVIQTNATADPAALLPDQLDLLQGNDMAALYRIRHAVP